MLTFQVGDTVEITNSNRSDYGKTGTIARLGSLGGWYVKFEDGTESYVPFGIARAYIRKNVLCDGSISVQDIFGMSFY